MKTDTIETQHAGSESDAAIDAANPIVGKETLKPRRSGKAWSAITAALLGTAGSLFAQVVFVEDFSNPLLPGWTSGCDRFDHPLGTPDICFPPVASGGTVQLHAKGSCFSGPFNGLAATLTQTVALPNGTYYLQHSVSHSTTLYGFCVGGTGGDSGILVNGVPITSVGCGVSGHCGTCTKPTEVVGGCFTVDNGLAEIKLRANGGDCAEVFGTFDDIVITAVASPSCSAGGPYYTLAGAPGSIRLNGAASADPGGNPLSYHWTTDCPGASFDDPTSPTPLLTLPAGDCGQACTVTLTVANGCLSSSCSAAVIYTKVRVDVYRGFTASGGGAPYSGLVGSFDAAGISFATSAGYAWHPFDMFEFGADITGYLNVAAEGTYTFSLNSDDGSVLLIDGAVVVDNGEAHGPDTASGTVTLTAGRHCFEVQFFECCGGPSGVDLTLPEGVTYGCPPTCGLICPDNISVCNSRPGHGGSGSGGSGHGGSGGPRPGQCGAVVEYALPTGGPDCDGVTVTCSPASGSFFPVGSTPVTCTAVDGCGRVIDRCSFIVTVNDCEPPSILCPADLEVCNDAGLCSAVVTYRTPAGVDNCSGAETVQTAGLPSGSSFPKGTTVNTFIVTDAAGNTATCSFSVTVKDCEAPLAACVPTTNPAGGTVPPAGKNPKSGQNPDGFYQLNGSDNCGAPQLFVKDSASSFVAGPFNPGDKVKITQAPGVTPNQKPMAGVIVAHVQLKGDALVYAVDASGNVPAVSSCFVPPLPK